MNTFVSLFITPNCAESSADSLSLSKSLSKKLTKKRRSLSLQRFLTYIQNSTLLFFSRLPYFFTTTTFLCKYFFLDTILLSRQKFWSPYKRVRREKLHLLKVQKNLRPKKKNDEKMRKHNNKMYKE